MTETDGRAVLRLRPVVASNLRAVREGAGLDQAELARRMRARGLNWSQARVSLLELGQGDLRFVEACYFADEFNIPVTALLDDGDAVNAVVAFRANFKLLADQAAHAANEHRGRRTQLGDLEAKARAQLGDEQVDQILREPEIRRLLMELGSR